MAAVVASAEAFVSVSRFCLPTPRLCAGQARCVPRRQALHANVCFHCCNHCAGAAVAGDAPAPTGRVLDSFDEGKGR